MSVEHSPDIESRECATLGAGNLETRFAVRCSCRWQSNMLEQTREAAARAHGAHVAGFAAMVGPDLAAGDLLEFDGQPGPWLVRATASGGRYAVATREVRTGALPRREVHYTIVDRLKDIRGALDVVGGGMGIDTTSGHDDGVEDVVRSLEGRPSEFDVTYYGDSPEAWVGAGEVSHRNWVYLNITSRTPAPTVTARA